MGDSTNGLQQSPFSEAACPVPDSHSGDQGIGGGIDIPGGPQGIVSAPWTEKPAPTLGGEATGTRDLPDPTRFASVDGSTYEGSSEMGPVGNVTGSRNTIDKR